MRNVVKLLLIFSLFQNLASAENRFPKPDRKRLRVSILHLSHFATVHKGKLVSGIGKYFLDHVSKAYNFSTEVDIRKKPLGRHPNGTWQGYFGDLKENRSDVHIFATYPHDRHGHFIFSNYIFYGYFKFYAAPGAIGIDWKAMIYLFQLNVWLLTMAVIAASTPILYFELRGSEPRIGRKKFPSETLYQACLIPFLAILQTNIRFQRGGICLTMLLVFFGLVMSNCYSSNLISFLTLPEKEHVARTFDALTKPETRGLYNISVIEIPGGSDATYVKESASPKVMNLRKGILWDRNFLRCVRDAVFINRKICVGWDVAVDTILASKFSTVRDWRALIPSQDSLIESTGHLVLARESPYGPFWNHVIGWTRDMGLFSRWEDLTLEYAQRQSGPADPDVKDRIELLAARVFKRSASSLTLENNLFTFGLLIGGLSVALVSFCVEIFCRLKLHRLHA